MRLAPRVDSQIRCALCHGHLDGPMRVCRGCSTTLHDDCWQATERCPTLGCPEHLRIKAVPRAGRFHRLLRATAPILAALVFVLTCLGIGLTLGVIQPSPERPLTVQPPEPVGTRSDSTPAVELDANGWIELGRTAASLGDFRGAIEDFTRALELDRDNACALANRGWAFCMQGDFVGSIFDNTRAVELDPKNVHAWVNLGWARVEIGGLDGSIQASTRAIELDPRIAAAWSNRGLAKKKKGDLVGCLSDSMQGLALDPANVHARARCEWAIAELSRR